MPTITDLTRAGEQSLVSGYNASTESFSHISCSRSAVISSKNISVCHLNISVSKKNNCMSKGNYFSMKQNNNFKKKWI